jgi:protein-arginine kinase
VLSTIDYSATILSKDEDISIMLNERDHIVESCTKPGLNLVMAYDTRNVVDNEIL